jgi:hypothetical protein
VEEREELVIQNTQNHYITDYQCLDDDSYINLLDIRQKGRGRDRDGRIRGEERDVGRVRRAGDVTKSFRRCRWRFKKKVVRYPTKEEEKETG